MARAEKFHPEFASTTLASVPGTRPSFIEAALLIAIAFGQFIAGSVFALQYGYLPLEASVEQMDKIAASMGLMDFLFGAMALVFLRGCGHRVSELLPAPDLRGTLEGLALGALVLAACVAVDALMPFKDSVMEQFAENSGGSKLSLGMMVASALLTSLYHETFLLGYLMRVFAPYGLSFALGLTVLVRLLYQLHGGPAGAVWVLVLGTLLGLVYWRTRRLWPVVVANAVMNLWMWY